MSGVISVSAGFSGSSVVAVSSCRTDRALLRACGRVISDGTNSDCWLHRIWTIMASRTSLRENDRIKSYSAAEETVIVLSRSAVSRTGGNSSCAAAGRSLA